MAVNDLLKMQIPLIPELHKLEKSGSKSEHGNKV